MNQAIKIVIALIVVYLIFDNFEMIKNNVPDTLKNPICPPKKDETKKFVSTSDAFAKCSPEEHAGCENPEMEHLSRK